MHTPSILLAGMMLALASHAGAAPVPVSASADFQRMDSNKDGKLSAEEHAAGARQMFVAMDSNKDNKVSGAEMDAAHKASPQGDAKAMSSAEKIRTIDTDGDGALSADEHRSGAVAMFSKMDSNKDNMLSLEEMAAGHQAMLAPRQY